MLSQLPAQLIEWQISILLFAISAAVTTDDGANTVRCPTLVLPLKWPLPSSSTTKLLRFQLRHLWTRILMCDKRRKRVKWTGTEKCEWKLNEWLTKWMAKLRQFNSNALSLAMITPTIKQSDAPQLGWTRLSLSHQIDHRHGSTLRWHFQFKSMCAFEKLIKLFKVENEQKDDTDTLYTIHILTAFESVRPLTGVLLCTAKRCSLFFSYLSISIFRLQFEI